MKQVVLFFLLFMSLAVHAVGVGGNGMYQYSVELRGYISSETGKSPVAYLWIPDGCAKVNAVILSQQNMTEEALYKMPSFQKKMQQLGVAMIWVAPAFSNNWDPQTPCQTIFDDMMTALAYQSGHLELQKAAVIPFGHSAQATFPWNFAAWNNNRTLCIISFHGDAPRTNLCGYGTSNIEWGRTRNIDGIPGLMIEGEYEWWEARVRPALAFRMMYPESCISFLCDTGHGHFDLCEETADYISRFIHKSLEKRLQADGTLRKVNSREGVLYSRFVADIPQTDGTQETAPAVNEPATDPHDSFWYFDREMADMTARRYASTKGKKIQYVGILQNGKYVPYNEKQQGGMQAPFQPDKDGITFHLTPVYTDATHGGTTANHGKGRLHIEVICGPVKKIDDTTFRIVPYEAGWDNPRRAFSVWLCAVADADGDYKGAVQPLSIRLHNDIQNKIK